VNDESVAIRVQRSGFVLAYRSAMQRILVVFRAGIDVETVRRRCALDVAQPHEMAVCYVLQADEMSVEAAVEAQRRITLLLRQALDHRAETIPIFVVTERDGDQVDDCAREWAATEVDA
jgi:hypothetical protein